MSHLNIWEDVGQEGGGQHKPHSLVRVNVLQEVRPLVLEVLMTKKRKWNQKRSTVVFRIRKNPNLFRLGDTGMVQEPHGNAKVPNSPTAQNGAETSNFENTVVRN